MAFERWKNKIKKTEVPEDEWEELVVPSQTGIPLGKAILDNYLQKDGDVIEIELERNDRRAMGNFMRALNKAKGDKNIEFLLRYSKDGKRAYVRRVG